MREIAADRLYSVNRQKRTLALSPQDRLERAKGIEPSYEAWEASVLPLNYARPDRRR
jgi:hypothetical protein